MYVSFIDSFHSYELSFVVSDFCEHLGVGGGFQHECGGGVASSPCTVHGQRRMQIRTLDKNIVSEHELKLNMTSKMPSHYIRISR